jgi:capsular exopolysaccharide synthesis family protein
MGLFSNNKKPKQFVSGSEHGKTLHKNLDFTATEQYKLIRANLNFTLPGDEKCPIIGVTSSMRGEGKSTTAVNLSYVLAASGKKVLLIDGDMRIPSIAKKMDINGDYGLTNYLMKTELRPLDTLKTDVLDNWYIMPAGELPPNPSELIGSRRMGALLESMTEEFDYIIVDLPPVNIVSDALAISKYIHGLIVVIREDYTEKKELETCFRQLSLSNVNVLGCVINGTKSGKGYYSKYRYKRYYKYYKTYGGYDTATKK